MTMLELLTAAAIGLVVVAAAFSMFTAMNQMQEKADRKLESIAELNIATQRAMRVIENAGMNLKSARLSVRVTNNLPRIFYFDTQSNTMRNLDPVARTVPDGGATPAGFIQESDMVDVLVGYPPTVRAEGRVLASNFPGGSAGQVRLDGWSPIATTAQLPGFVPASPPGLFSALLAPRYLVFSGRSSGISTACLAKVIDASNVPNTGTVTYEHVLVGYGANGGPALYSTSQSPSFPTFPANDAATVSSNIGGPGVACPGVGFSVYGVAARTLYAVARLNANDRPGLYEFNYNFATDRFEDPVLMSAGVDDMAVHPLIASGVNVISDVTDGGANASNFPYTDPTALAASQVVGLTVRMLSRGLSDVHETSTDAGVWFSDGNVPGDGLKRDLREARVPLNNLNPIYVLPD